MTDNLIRTTTYFDKDLLYNAKLTALERGTSVYEILNEWMARGRKVVRTEPVATKNSKKEKIKLEEVFKPKPLGLKGTFRRIDLYDWL